MNKQEIYMKELNLNIKHQDLKIDTIMQVGYEVEPGHFVFMLMFPKKMFKWLK